MKDISEVVGGVVIILIFLGVLWGAVHLVGSFISPTVQHHPQENADCYTAGKMFFVSISCVRREE